jgi:hypothetical protein
LIYDGGSSLLSKIKPHPNVHHVRTNAYSGSVVIHHSGNADAIFALAVDRASENFWAAFGSHRFLNSPRGRIQKVRQRQAGSFGRLLQRFDGLVGSEIATSREPIQAEPCSKSSARR